MTACLGQHKPGWSPARSRAQQAMLALPRHAAAPKVACSARRQFRVCTALLLLVSVGPPSMLHAGFPCRTGAQPHPYLVCRNARQRFLDALLGVARLELFMPQVQGLAHSRQPCHHLEILDDVRLSVNEWGGIGCAVKDEAIQAATRILVHAKDGIYCNVHIYLQSACRP